MNKLVSADSAWFADCLNCLLYVLVTVRLTVEISSLLLEHVEPDQTTYRRVWDLRVISESIVSESLEDSTLCLSRSVQVDSTRTDAKAYSVYCFLFAQVLDWLAEFLALFGGHKGGMCIGFSCPFELWKAQERSGPQHTSWTRNFKMFQWFPVCNLRSHREIAGNPLRGKKRRIQIWWNNVQATNATRLP